MPKNLRNREEREELKRIKEEMEQIADVTAHWLLVTISCLIAVFVILLLKIGQTYWPIWLIENRRQGLAVVLLITTVVTLLSPLIIEVNSNPRPLKGPGRGPRYGSYWTNR